MNPGSIDNTLAADTCAVCGRELGPGESVIRDADQVLVFKTFGLPMAEPRSEAMSPICVQRYKRLMRATKK